MDLEAVQLVVQGGKCGHQQYDGKRWNVIIMQGSNVGNIQTTAMCQWVLTNTRYYVLIVTVCAIKEMTNKLY